MQTVLLFNMQQTVWIGLFLLDKHHKFMVFKFSSWVWFSFHAPFILRRTWWRKSSISWSVFFLMTVWISQYKTVVCICIYFFKASFCFINFPESKSCICATWSLLHVLPPHLYTDAYVSIEDTINIQSIWPLFLYLKNDICNCSASEVSEQNWLIIDAITKFRFSFSTAED